jgi:hypothetical protein
MNEDIKIKNMFDYQLKDIEGEEYQKYLNYLNIFYEKRDLKKSKYNKEYIDNKFVLVDKVSPSKKIKITPSKFIDIHSLYIELKNYSDEILEKISLMIESNHNITDENRKDFDNLKKKYVIFQEKIKDIDTIFSNFYEKITKLINLKIEKLNEMANFYQKRIYEYSNITVMIREKLKNKLIQIFKENKNKIPPLGTQISKIAKENDIPADEIEKWFKWIELSYFYIILQREIYKITDEINDSEKNYEINTRFMIIKKYNIEFI